MVTTLIKLSFKATNENGCDIVTVEKQFGWHIIKKITFKLYYFC